MRGSTRASGCRARSALFSNTASSGTYSLSRLATAAMPFVVVPILNGAGPGALFAVVCAAMVVVAVDVALLGPRVTGRALEEMNERATA